MTEHCVIQADFAGFRIVAGRKVAQLVLEIPVEKSDEALRKLGGIPQPGASRWCAVALLNDKPEAPQPAQTSVASGSPKKSFSELPLVQQVGIRCSDTTFQEFMKAETETEAANAVRRACSVSSRAEIVQGSPAGAIWLQMERHYQSWLTDRQFAQVRR